MPGLAAMAAQVVAEDQQARRPVAVRIVQDADQDDGVEDQATDATGDHAPACRSADQRLTAVTVKAR